MSVHISCVAAGIGYGALLFHNPFCRDPRKQEYLEYLPIYVEPSRFCSEFPSGGLENGVLALLESSSQQAANTIA